MPVRFTSPSLGGQRDSFFKKGEWQLSAAFRRLYADQWFVGHDVNEAAAPFGKQLYLDINSLDVTITYGLSRRASVAVTLPMSHGTHSRYYADGERHKVVAQGIGDVNAIGTFWLLEPNMHLDGNVALGFGVKTPNRREEMQLSRIFFRPMVPLPERSWTNPFSLATARGDSLPRHRRISVWHRG